MLGRLISRIGMTLAWFMPMGTDSSVLRVKNQFASVEAFMPLPAIGTSPLHESCGGQTLTTKEADGYTYTRIQCDNTDWSYMDTASVPTNRRQRRARTRQSKPAPYYIAEQAPRKRTMQLESIGAKSGRR